MQEAADLATKRGAPISKSWISSAAAGIESITPQLIRGICAGYDLSEEDVARAALADLGVTISDYSPTVESAIRRDANLSGEARAILLAGVAAARETRREETASNWDQPRRRAVSDAAVRTSWTSETKAKGDARA